MKKMLIVAGIVVITAASYFLYENFYSKGSPKVKLETSMGTVILELYPEKAPKSVENFLKYCNDGAYNSTLFHRVIKGFMNQGGGFTADFNRTTTRAPVTNEADNGLKNLRGTIAMARTSDPHSATNQFFINTTNNPFLDFKSKDARGWGYTVFGKVVAGINVMDEIANVQTGAKGPFRSDVPQVDVLIIKATAM